MDLIALTLHLLNFAAPAAALAVVLPVVARIGTGNVQYRRPWWGQSAVIFAVCALTLLSGLVFFGRDGKMTTYLAMVLTGGTAQWVLGRSVKR